MGTSPKLVVFDKNVMDMVTCYNWTNSKLCYFDWSFQAHKKKLYSMLEMIHISKELHLVTYLYVSNWYNYIYWYHVFLIGLLAWDLPPWNIYKWWNNHKIYSQIWSFSHEEWRVVHLLFPGPSLQQLNWPLRICQCWSLAKVERQMLLTWSWHVFTLEPTTDMIMLPSQDPIEEFAFASTQRFEVAQMVEIQNLKDMHVQEMDVLQSQIFRLITNLWALTTSNAWRKKPMTTYWMNRIRKVGIEA